MFSMIVAKLEKSGSTCPATELIECPSAPFCSLDTILFARIGLALD